MSTSLAMSPAAGGGDNGGGGGAEEKKVVMEEAREELDHTLDLRLCSDVMMAETEEKAERESGSGSKGSDGNGEEKRGFYCKYCNKKFANSQALGGHQNAHKRERGSSKKDKVDEEAFAQIESHLYPYSSIAPYNRLYGSYRKPLGVQSQSMISKPMHSWSRGGLGYGYGGVGGGWPRYSMMNSAQFPIINRARQPSMMNSQYGAAQPPLGTSNYWGGAAGVVGGAGGRCGFQQPPPPAPSHTRHFNNMVGYHHHQPPPPPPAQTRGLINLGGIDTTAFRRTFEGISLQIATSKPLDNGIVGCSEYKGGGGVVAETSLRQEVRGGGLLKKEKQEEAKEIDLSLRL